MALEWRVREAERAWRKGELGARQAGSLRSGGVGQAGSLRSGGCGAGWKPTVLGCEAGWKPALRGVWERAI